MTLLSLLLGVAALCLAVPLVAGLSRPLSATTYLTVLLFVLLVVPAALVLPGLRSFGSLPFLVGMGALVAWFTARETHQDGLDVGRQPVRAAGLLFVLTSLTALASAYARPLSSLEAGGATRSAAAVLALIGVMLMAADMSVDRACVDRLLQRAVLFGAVSAVGGVCEAFFPGFRYAESLSVPGLVANFSVFNETRSSFFRILGSATHPIEFSVALAMLVPVALHYAMTLRPGAWRTTMRIALVLQIAALPLSVARTGVLALGVALLVLSVAWTWRQRFHAAVLATIGTVALGTVVPGLIGTIRGLFLSIGEDPSSVSRQEDVPRVLAIVSEHPWFGIGLGTFQPQQYFYLDNQYFGAAIEGGVPHMLAFVVVLLVGIGCARGVARTPGPDPAARHLGQALAASLAAFAVSAATFDALAFRQAAFLAFLFIGLAGALWRMSKDEVFPAHARPLVSSAVVPLPQPAGSSPPRPARRRPT